MKDEKRDKLKRKLRKHLDTAGFEQSFHTIIVAILVSSLFISLFAIIGYTYLESTTLFTVPTFLWALFAEIFVFYPATVILLTVAFLFASDVRIENRRTQIEKVFPEFLHLVAANVRAGMTIDQALWKATRPSFGILAKEIEIVAKQSMVGTDLSIALVDFSNKYDSKITRRAISLLVEGINAGSEIAELLENVALNIEDLALRKESMSANVTSNAIFISFAVLFASPLLFAIAAQLLYIVQTVGAKVNNSGGGGFSISTDAVSQSDFLVFCVFGIIASSTMSTIIIAAIKSGKPTDAIKDLPIYWGVPLTLFFAMRWVLNYLFAGVF